MKVLLKIAMLLVGVYFLFVEMSMTKSDPKSGVTISFLIGIAFLLCGFLLLIVKRIPAILRIIIGILIILGSIYLLLDMIAGANDVAKAFEISVWDKDIIWPIAPFFAGALVILISGCIITLETSKKKKE